MFPNHFSRRHFLKHVAGFSLMAGPSLSFVQKLVAAAPNMRREHKSLIVMWMGGGPSHMDSFDMKPGESTAGEFKPMKTSADGVQICEHLPTLAAQMKHLSIVRSLVTNEGSHERGRTLMHTANPPNPALQFPSMGSIVAMELTPKELALPGFITVGGSSEGPGFLGMAYAPFTVQNPGSPPQNISPPGDLGRDQELKERMLRRGKFFETVEMSFLREGHGQSATAHKEVYQKAFDLTYSQLKNVFDLELESDGKSKMSSKLRDDYGRNNFGNGCLLARKLVEAGVPCVEVDMGGWDNHNGIFRALHNTNQQGGLLDRVDKGFGTLVKDLVDRGLWKHTVVVWMGEFGRTPKLNQNGGRDHWPRCWSVVVGGGGLKGGLAYGSTDKDGGSVKDNPCSVSDLFATLYQGLGIPPDKEIRDTIGRPHKISGDKGGKPIAELVKA